MRTFTIGLMAVLLNLTCLKIKGQVTFNDIAPIIYNRCMVCHRPGEIGPFSLITYNEVASMATTIKNAVNNRIMPPWSAKPNAQHPYRGERILSAIELSLINDWVDGGAPEGNPNLLPPPPVFPTGSVVGIPDLVLTPDSAYSVPQLGTEDKYRTFVIPTNLPQDRPVRAVEFRPGNSAIVHHSLMNQDTTGNGRQRDAQDPGLGFDDVSFNEFTSIKGLGSWAPGAPPMVYPEGIGKTLMQNSDILMQVHYPFYASGQSDRSTLNIFYHNQPITRPVYTYLIWGTHTMSRISSLIPDNIANFIIPANQVVTHKARMRVNEDFSLMTIGPHMHLLGVSSKSYAITPSGDTIHLCTIDKWDFRWQDQYHFDKFVKIPKNSWLYHEATYDNTSNNPNNPRASNPQLVVWGEDTYDEMIFCTFEGVAYEEGDENRRTTALEPLEERLNRVQLGSPVPNPVIAGQDIQVELALDYTHPLSIDVLDVNGKVVNRASTNQPFHKGVHQLRIRTVGLTKGLYLVRFANGSEVLTRKFLVAENH